jgi:putative DNA primase/helicase
LTTYVAFKDGEKYPAKDAEISDNINTFADAGYLLDKTDLIVDIDNKPKEFIEAIIQEFNINTQIVWTDRGAHFYFLKPDGWRGAQGVSLLGFGVEYKHIKNTKAITVKRNGVAREIENEGKREALPSIFKTKRKLEDLYGLSEGDGRDNKLYSHRMRIGMESGWPQMVEFINNWVFADALEPEDIDRLTRDVKPDAEKNGEAAIADQVMNDKKVVSYMSSLWFQQDDKYILNYDKLRRLIYHYAPGKPTRYVDEVIKQMKYRSHIVEESKAVPIRLKNGVLMNGDFIEVDYTEFTPYVIDIAYNPDAKKIQEVDNYLHHVTKGEPQYRDLFLEMMAYTLITDVGMIKALAKFFIIVGDGGNGKGTALDIIRTILGEDNTSSLDIDHLANEKYSNQMIGKLANLGDDIKDQPINEKKMKALKNISTADRIPVRRLYEDPGEARMTCTLIFTSNHIIKSFEKGRSFKRRVSFMPLFAEVTKPDPRFLEKVLSEQALEYWMKLLIEAYQRLYEKQAFTSSPIVDKFNENYHRDNDSTLEFLEDMTQEDLLGKRLKEVYEEYEQWAEDNGMSVLSKRQLSTNIRVLLGLELTRVRVGKQLMRVYKPIQDDE